MAFVSLISVNKMHMDAGLGPIVELGADSSQAVGNDMTLMNEVKQAIYYDEGPYAGKLEELRESQEERRTAIEQKIIEKMDKLRDKAWRKDFDQLRKNQTGMRRAIDDQLVEILDDDDGKDVDEDQGVEKE